MNTFATTETVEQSQMRRAGGNLVPTGQATRIGTFSGAAVTRIGTFAGGVVTRVGTFSDTETREQAWVRTAVGRRRDMTDVPRESKMDETLTRHGRPGPDAVTVEREMSTVS